jgi:hypothetical protein
VVAKATGGISNGRHSGRVKGKETNMATADADPAFCMDSIVIVE